MSTPELDRLQSMFGWSGGSGGKVAQSDASSYHNYQPQQAVGGGGDLEAIAGILSQQQQQQQPIHNSYQYPSQQLPHNTSPSPRRSERSAVARRRLVDHEDDLRHVISALISQADALRADCTLRLAKGKEYADDFETESKSTVVANMAGSSSLTDSTTTYTVPSLIAECDLSVVYKEVQSLEHLKAPSLQAEPFGSLLQHLNALLDDNALNAQRVRSALHETDGQVKALQVAIDQNDLWRDQALYGEDNVAAGEHHYKQLVAMLEQLMQVVHHRIGIASGLGNQSAVMKDFDDTLQRLMAEVARHRDANTSLRGRLQSDVQKIESKRAATAREDQAKALEYDRRHADDMTALDHNSRHQEEAWQRLSRALDDLNNLSGERLAIVASLVDAREAEQRRKAAVDRTSSVCDQHVAALTSISRELDQFDKLFAEATRCGEDAKRRLMNRVQDVDSVLRDVRLDEQKNHLSVYRRYTVTVGDYIYRREKRAGDITRASRALDLSREVARDVLDRNGSRYDSDRVALDMELEEIAKEVNELRGRMDKATKLFAPTDAALQHAKVSFVHPTKLLSEHLAKQEQEQREIRRKYQE
eukprot:PhM_4_TR8183/c0_g1_i1/m.81496